MPHTLQTAILTPVFLQIFLTFAILVSMGSARSASLRATRTHMNDKSVALGTYDWSEEAAKRASSFRNQFELPVLFYAAVALALILRQADALMTGLAWIFVVTRIAHATIHTGGNRVSQRFIAYLAGAAALALMWLVLAWRVLISGV
jgi:hypothetical protein